MPKAQHFLIVLGLTVITLLGAAAASPSPGPEPRFRPALGRDQVVIAYQLEPTFGIGRLSRYFPPSEAIKAAIHTIDVQYDENWRPFPQGVVSLPSLRDGTWQVSGDKMVLTWRLRPRQWHDGRPVTCGDYVFSHQVARTLDPPPRWTRIGSVSCPNGAAGMDVRVHFKERAATAYNAVIPPGPLPRHLLEPLFRQGPSRLLETYGVDPQLTIGDGAYRLVEWRKGESITVEAVPNHGIFGTPAIRRVTWRFMPPGRRVAALLAGTIDAAPVTWAEALELRGQPGIKVLAEEGTNWGHIDFNLDNPLLQDVRVRRAIAHAINRQQLIAQVSHGMAIPSHTYLPRKHRGHSEAVTRYPYDPARARALLRAAGFAPGPDGVAQNAAGQRMVLEFNTTSEVPDRLQAQRIIQQQLREVGIEVLIENFPPRVFLLDFLQQRRFKAMAMYAWALDADQGCRSRYTADRIPSAENNWTGDNFPGYRNAEMDRLCRQEAEELDQEKRMDLLRQTAAIFSRDLPALPLSVLIFPFAAKSGLENITGYPLQGLEGWNIHTWRWR